MRLDYDSQISLPAMFFSVAEQRGITPCLWAKQTGAWQSLSWNETAENVRLLARGLAALGVAHGDRVALASENRPEWLIADLGIMAAGAVTVPAYTTNTPADHQHILSNSGAKAVIVSTQALADKVAEAALRLPRPPLVITLEPWARAQNPGLALHSWNEVLEMGRNAPDVTEKNLAQLNRKSLACIIHTSGTGGTPKGVMLSHGAILHNCKGAHRLLLELGLENEVFLSFLPLSHSYEHTAGQFFPVSIGAQIYYAEGADTLLANLAEAQPTIMTAVPRLYEMIRSRILRQIERAPAARRALFEAALRLGLARQKGERLGLWESIQDVVLDILVRKKVRARFGGRLKAFVSGGAPLNPEVGLFFSALGLRVLQGYGQTESAPVVSCNPPSKVKMDTVGPALIDTEVKIAEDGEILVRGELVMDGYWNDPDATAQAIQNGWLHTGDVGEIDEDGFIRITDRKKDLIVNSGGDNIAPQRIEGFLALQPEIAQAMVYGDKRPHLVALLIPDAEWSESWARKHGAGMDMETLISNPDFRKALSVAVDRVNAQLSNIEKVRRFALLPQPFSVADGTMTPTLKIRRHRIRELYGEKITALYD